MPTLTRQRRSRHIIETDQWAAISRADHGVPADPVRVPGQQTDKSKRDNDPTKPTVPSRAKPGRNRGLRPVRTGNVGGSGRFTSINGAVLGHLDNAVAGGDRTLANDSRRRARHDRVAVAQTTPGAADPANLKAADAQATSNQLHRQAVPLHLLAADGLTMASVKTVNEAVFQPGYRWDALIAFPEAGDYCVINDLAGSQRERQSDRPRHSDPRLRPRGRGGGRLRNSFRLSRYDN